MKDTTKLILLLVLFFGLMIGVIWYFISLGKEEPEVMTKVPVSEVAQPEIREEEIKETPIEYEIEEGIDPKG